MRLKKKKPNIIELAITTAFTVVENKIPNGSNLIQKTDYNTKVSEFKIKLLLIMIMINIILLKNLMS